MLTRLSLLFSLLLAILAAVPSTALAQAAAATDDDHAIVYELGWAGAWSHDEGWQAKGATFAFETTPIEGILEIEGGVTVLRSHGSTETSFDFLFKKPWTISKKVEFMAGVGPELAHSSEDGTFWGLSAAADLMVWPKKNVGWYLEPGFENDFVHGRGQRGFAMAAGLLIGR